MRIEPSKVLVVVPALNEEATIGPVVEQVRAAGFEVAVISDGSTDKTADRARTAGARVLELPVNLGVGGALRAGFRFAVSHDFDAVVQIDADDQHPIHEINRLIEAANNSGAHLVIGSRFTSEDATLEVSFVRRTVMRILARSATRAANSPITDATSGFRLIARPLLEEFALSFPSYYLGDTYEALVSAGRSGYVIREVPAALRPRLVGESSANPRQATQLTLKSLALVLLRIHFPITQHRP